ncbi:MAG: hypothetical protein ACLF0P_16745 [Thermoanaerobaculia bacterium]
MIVFFRWFPWRQIVSRVARAKGLIDPIRVLSRLESFAQPLEVKEPLELLRSGLVFHARGLLNTAIQHNLDWVWPFWVERQYDPRDVAFIPRAFSITHVNLTHRNWTAVGVPGFDELPIVDPRGLATPFWDSWSLDAWVLGPDGTRLVPSRVERAVQRMDCCGPGGDDVLAVVTECAADGLELASRGEVEAPAEGEPRLVLRVTASAGGRSASAGGGDGWLVIALRPYNPEGVSFVHRIALEGDRRGWTVGKGRHVRFSEPADRHRFSDYHSGDVWARLPEGGHRGEIHCTVGMATAAALFRLEAGRPRTVAVSVPLGAPRAGKVQTLLRRTRAPSGGSWPQALDGVCRLRTPHRRHAFLYESALRSLVLHSPGRDVYPGPYTYRRFWFRDAAFILHALACAGLFGRVEPCLDSFPGRQTRAGFFLSQEGEWDSNGEALWILRRSAELSGRPVPEAWRKAVVRGARWILDKRVDAGGTLHAGLLPPGFSAEHLGPNDYYYWDDFWGVAGLDSAAWLLEDLGRPEEARPFREGAADLLAAVEASAAGVAERLGRPGLPASPYRRLDSGAVGSLAGSYPLQVWAPDDPRVLDTARYLVESCLVDGGFFLDVIHSGVNPYLTLHLAQVLLRAGDPDSVEGARDLIRTVAELASPTGQWPEAVHPRTRGGCMGDGHHVWASAEWVLAVRNAFVREEGDGLVLASGVLPEWLEEGQETSFGPAPTPWGPVTVRLVPEGGRVHVSWEGDWRGEPPPVVARPPALPLERVSEEVS